LTFSAIALTGESIPTWQQQLAGAFTSINDLCEFLSLDPARLAPSETAAGDFPLKVPLSFAQRMTKGNPDDPLLRQVLPLLAETTNNPPGYSDDPVGDLNAAVIPGLLHKYHGRVLMINTGTCAIHCRYCFRRNFPYQDQQLGKHREQETVAYLAENPDITEVILSGGDPLLLGDARLQTLFGLFEPITHLQRIRIHSRIPVVLPARMTETLNALLAHTTKKVILVLHCNHPNELSEEIKLNCLALQRQGVTLLNQAVLLKDINDNAETLINLSEKLFACGVLPYYLHLLDKARGTAHFEVGETAARDLMACLQSKLPGYLVPKLVKEVPQAGSKQLIF
jgi:L-lysine 2,3-aminomutase